MDTWLNASGKLVASKDSVRIVTSNDLILYYKSFVDKKFGMFTNCPAHGSHITLWNNKLHGNLSNKKIQFLRKYYEDKTILFEYNPNIIIGGLTKSFINFYMKVKCNDAVEICEYLPTDQHHHLHITISNTKGGSRPYVWYK